MWSRDKQSLSAAGIELQLDGADRFLCPRQPRLPLPRDGSAALVARVRALPLDGDLDLELALRKLAILGAPLLGALMDRAALAPLPRRKPTAHALSVATLLLAALEAAGEDGLLLTEAVAISGARDEDDLRRVVRLLEGVDLPFEPPFDIVPIELTPDAVRLYMPTLAASPPALTAREWSALRAASILECADRPELAAA